MAAATAVVSILGGCNSGSHPASAGEQKEQVVSYTTVPLDQYQRSDLQRFGLDHMANGTIGDIAMVVTPQPPNTPRGKLLVAVQYGECGHTLGRARVVGDTLVIEKNSPKGGGDCGGTERTSGLLVTLPKDAMVKAARIEPTS
jgi:hypothetical protein